MRMSSARTPTKSPVTGLNLSSRVRPSVFDQLPVDGRKYKFQYVYTVRYDQEACHKALAQNFTRRALNPGIITLRQYHEFNTKTFYHAKGFISTDQGNHYGEVEHDRGQVNNHPEVTAHMDTFFVMSGLSLLHFPISTMHTWRLKTLRAADAYGYNDTTDCSAVISGHQYCTLAKMLRSDEARSRSHFLQECIHRRNIGLPINSFQQWFVDHAMSLDEMIGEAAL